jgi:hypothetical protein
MSDFKKIRNYQKSRQPKPPISKAAHRANCEYIVDSLLMPVVDKLRNSPADIRPVSETYQELLAQMHGVKRQPYIMQAGKRRLVVCDDEVIELEYQPSEVPPTNTKIISGGDTEKVSQSNTILTAEEIAILATLK